MSEGSHGFICNRFAFANGNPVSYVDPFGLSPERGATQQIGLQKFKNSDDTFSLHDNYRYDPDSVFHEQLFVISPSSPSFNLKEGDVGIGGLQADFVTGGWEWEYVDLSLLDFGHVEAGAEFKNKKFQFGAMASIWSPSLTVNIFGIEIEFGVEVGAIGSKSKVTNNGVSFSIAVLFGGNFSISW